MENTTEKEILMIKKRKDELKPDTVLKDYWKQKDVFADLFNAYVFGGKEVLKAEGLVEKDTDSSTVLTVDDADISIQATRDLLKVVMSYNGVEYAILGLENQDYIHYALPLKIEGYDVYSYDRQYKQKKADYKKFAELTGDERMSGIKKTDRFTPLVTLVIYYGSEPWDGPTCLYDMLALPEELKPFVNNFKVNLVEARANNLVFHNQNNEDLFSLLRIIYDDTTDRKERRKQIEAYEKDRQIDKSVRMAVAATSKISLQKFEKEENVAMCKLWDEVREDGFMEGEALGETNGEAKGIVKMGKEFGLSKEQIIEKIAGNLNIEVAAAEKYYEMFSVS
jgi:hypothetical protein